MEGNHYRDSERLSTITSHRDSEAWPSYATRMATNSKSLPDEQNERLRGIVRELVAREFQGNASHAARAFGVTQSLVSEFLAGARGAGPKLLGGIATHTGRSIDELYGRRVVPVADTSRAYQRLGDHPEFAAALEGAVEQSPMLARPQIEVTADVALSEPPEHITPAFLIRLAEALASARPYRRG